MDSPPRIRARPVKVVEVTHTPTHSQPSVEFLDETFDDSEMSSYGGMNLLEMAEVMTRPDDECIEDASDIIGRIPLLEVPEIKEGKTLDTKSAKFRVYNQRMILTYAQSDLDKTALKTFLQERSKKKDIPVKVKIARELHKDGQPHMHALVDYGYRFQSTNTRIFDFEDRHPNIKLITSMTHWANALCYLGKYDKSCKPLPSVVDAAKAWNCKTPQEALLCGIKDPIRAIALFENRPRPSARIISEPQQPWFHETLLPIIQGKSDHRSWHWFADFRGKVGKSYACKYLFSRYKSGENLDVLYLDLDCTMDNLCNLILMAQESGWTGKVILTDLPRSYTDNKQFYTNLEKLGNGFGTTAKYKGGSFLLDHDPIVVVFANWWPMLYDEKGVATASTDRWMFYYIEHSSLTARSMNLNEVRAEREESDETRLTEADQRRIVRRRVATEQADVVKPEKSRNDFDKYRRT